MVDAVVLKPGKYPLYKDRVGADKFHTANDKKGGIFTLHHIVPYRYPFLAGWLVEKILAAGATLGTGEKAGKLLELQIRKLCEAVLPGKVSFDDLKTKGGFGHKFAWMGGNLFVGPTSSVRVDDPGSTPEPLKPDSFDANHWKTAHLWKKALNAAGLDPVGGDSSGTPASVTVKREYKLFGGGELTKLLQALSMFSPYGKDAHPYEPLDWIIIDVDDRDDNTYSLTTEKKIEYYCRKTKTDVVKFASAKRPLKTDTIKGMKGLVKSSSKSKALVDKEPLKLKIMEYRPGLHRNVMFGGKLTKSYIVLWRLRKSGEQLPKHELKGNFTFQ